MADAFSIAFDTSALDAGLDALAAGAVAQVRPAAQAGAQVLYEEVLLRVPVAKRAHIMKGGRIIPPGALKASIYQAFSKDKSAVDHAVYHVSWNAKKAPHGHLVENGTSHAPAHSFIRSSFDAAAARALDAASVKWGNGMREVIAGVAA